MSLEADLAITSRNVTNVRRVIARQLLRIARLAELGCSTWDARENLQAFRSTLTVLEKHESHLREIKRRTGWA